MRTLLIGESAMGDGGFNPGWPQSWPVGLCSSLVDEDLGVAIGINVDPVRSLISVDVNETHSLDARHACTSQMTFLAYFESPYPEL
jgi:hypothetical protein